MTDDRSDFEYLRELREKVEELPDSIEPPRDLWPEIAASIRSGTDSGRTDVGDWTRRRTVRALLTAASLAILVLVPASVWWTGVSETPAHEIDCVTQRIAVALESETRLSPAEMRAWVPDSEETDEVVLLLQTELEALDLAIAETRQAWLADPDDMGLARALSRVCRVRTDLQRETMELVTRI